MMTIDLFFLFFKIGFFSFGGGYAMLPLIYQGASSLTGMTLNEFSRLVALSQMTPGPVAINASTYVGYQCAGIPGAAAATVGVVLPSVLLVFVISHFFIKYKENETFQGVLQGIRPATVGLLGSAVVFLAQGSIFIDMQLNMLPAVFFLAVLVLSGKFRMDPIALTILAGAAGAVIIR